MRRRENGIQQKHALESCFVSVHKHTSFFRALFLLPCLREGCYAQRSYINETPSPNGSGLACPYLNRFMTCGISADGGGGIKPVADPPFPPLGKLPGTEGADMSFTRILLLALALSAVVEVSRSEPTVTKQAAKAGFRAALRCKKSLRQVIYRYFSFQSELIPYRLARSQELRDRIARFRLGVGGGAGGGALGGSSEGREGGQSEWRIVAAFAEQK